MRSVIVFLFVVFVAFSASTFAGLNPADQNSFGPTTKYEKFNEAITSNCLASIESGKSQSSD